MVNALTKLKRFDVNDVKFRKEIKKRRRKSIDNVTLRYHNITITNDNNLQTLPINK